MNFPDLFNTSSISTVYYLILSLGILIIYIFNKIHKSSIRNELYSGAVFDMLQASEEEIVETYTQAYLKSASKILKEYPAVNIRTENLIITIKEKHPSDVVNDTEYNIRLKWMLLMHDKFYNSVQI